jgi:hypothetical protein
MRRACSCIQPGISTVAAAFDKGFPSGSGVSLGPARMAAGESVRVTREALGLRKALTVIRGLDIGFKSAASSGEIGMSAASAL